MEHLRCGEILEKAFGTFAVLAVALAAMLALVGCADKSAFLNIAPSAMGHRAAILEAVERLNAKSPDSALVWAQEADDGAKRNGETVIRGGEVASGLVAYTFRNRHGVTITLGPDADARAVGHEIGHAMGLKHHPDPGNLMFNDSRATGWELTEEQLEAFR